MSEREPTSAQPSKRCKYGRSPTLVFIYVLKELLSVPKHVVQPVGSGQIFAVPVPGESHTSTKRNGAGCLDVWMTFVLWAWAWVRLWSWAWVRGRVGVREGVRVRVVVRDKLHGVLGSSTRNRYISIDQINLKGELNRKPQ